LFRAAVVFGWTLSTVSAVASDCVALRDCRRGHEGAHCEFTRTAKVTALLPYGMHIAAVRGGTVFYRGNAFPSRQDVCRDLMQLEEPLRLDEHDWDGGLRIKGTFRATGRVVYEPNDGGDLYFAPDRMLLKSGGRFFRSRFSSIHLDGLGLTQITPPANLARTDCWQVKATLEMMEFEVAEEGSSKSGVYPDRSRILSLSKKFERCEWGK
jgi:hypothetical protein